jgi:hypothetical protein
MQPDVAQTLVGLLQELEHLLHDTSEVETVYIICSLFNTNDIYINLKSFC